MRKHELDFQDLTDSVVLNRVVIPCLSDHIVGIVSNVESVIIIA